MYRLANGTQVSTLPPAPAPVGTPGYGTDGDPGAGQLGSIFGAAEFNVIQEELMSFLSAAGITQEWANYGQVLAACHILFARAASTAAVIADAGLTPNPADDNQLRDAMRLLYGGGGTLGVTGHWRLPGGLILQWGNFAGTTGSFSDGVAENPGIAVTFPIAFPTSCWHVFAIPFDVDGGSLQETVWRTGSPTATGCSLGLSCKQAGTLMSGSYLAIGR
ncbi:gp53-like domain-containing protein [Roseomonas sp. F4]